MVGVRILEKYSNLLIFFNLAFGLQFRVFIYVFMRRCPSRNSIEKPYMHLIKSFDKKLISYEKFYACKVILFAKIGGCD